MKKILTVFLVLWAGICSAEQIPFDEDWKFIQKDVPEAQQVSFSDADWRTLDLPHDWSVEGKFDRSHPSTCLLYTSPSPRDRTRSRMPSSA